jgi:hypothetical protein
MAAPVLKFQHHARNYFRFNFIASIRLADIVVLTVLATQVAASKKNCS